MALDLNGSTQYLIATQSDITSGNCSFGAWFRSDQNTTNLVALSIGDSAGPINYPRHQITFAGGVASDPVRLTTINDAGASVGDVDKVGFTIGTWHHVLAVIQTTPSVSRVIYLDGSPSSTNTTSFTLNGMDKFVIGGREAGGVGALFDGQVADPCFWNVALTAAEALSLSRGVASAKVRPQNIKSQPPLIRETIDPRGKIYTVAGSPSVYPHPRIYY